MRRRRQRGRNAFENQEARVSSPLPVRRRLVVALAAVEGPVEVLTGRELDGPPLHEPARGVESLEDVASGSDIGERPIGAGPHRHRFVAVDIDRQRALALVEDDDVALGIECALVARREENRKDSERIERAAGERAHARRW